MKSFEKGWKIELSKLTIFMNNFDSSHVEIVHTSHLEDDFEIFVTLLIQL